MDTNIPVWYRIPNGDCIKRHSYWVGRVILAIGSQTRNRFHPYSSRSTRVSKVFKECDFGECTGKEIYPKALTFPIDNLLLERELVRRSRTQDSYRSRFRFGESASEMQFPLWIEKWNGCTIGKWGDFL